VRQGESLPETVTVEADGGGKLRLDGKNSTLAGEKVVLDGTVYVKNETLEALVERIVVNALGGMG
jgi:FKBP-type peptidyl-prolyl cis-trans isomerase 2